MNVEFEPRFWTGNFNTRFFKDAPFCSDEELRVLFDFAEDVKADREVEGKNKPSWQTDEGTVIPNTEPYNQGKYWHCHCNPFLIEKGKIYQKTVDLKKNINGKSSKAIIHYRKIGKNKIVIVAYSPEHVPFPNAYGVLNPLTMRKAS